MVQDNYEEKEQANAGFKKWILDNENGIVCIFGKLNGRWRVSRSRIQVGLVRMAVVGGFYDSAFYEVLFGWEPKLIQTIPLWKKRIFR